ncbi:MAG: radical SAM family heme chaperone HemW [Chitinophagaceae bacterium]
MAGIYIHIPFCKKACHYCNFHFSTSANNINEMAQAICIEAALRKNYITENIETIYFGGGTPSLLSIEDLQLIMENLKKDFLMDSDAEITLEANPDDIDEKKLLEWKGAGINRLSIGAQSFFDNELIWMNRAHNASQAAQSIELAQCAGFSNISIDLIYGSQTLSDADWARNVQQALALNIPHLSCYALTVEPKTTLQKMIEQHKIQNVDAEKQSHQFELLMQWMNDANYEHYEISNFAKQGMRSKHNSSYWQQKNYLGLGPSAHSFNGESRQWNVANNSLYIKNIQQNIIPFEIEYLSAEQKLNEYIMTSLRTAEGLSLQDVSENWSKQLSEQIFNEAGKWIEQSKIFLKNNHLILTNQGKLFADGIAANLFIEHLQYHF